MKNTVNSPGSVVDPQSPKEEIANAVTHGIGAALSIAGLVLLLVFSSRKGDAWRVVSFSVYGASLIILFTMSALSHAFTAPGVKRFFEFMDYSSIYLLIAGTYTPIMLVYLRGPWGWTVFGVIWAMAIGGIISKIFFLGKWDYISLIFYIIMGWLLVTVLKPLLAAAPAGFVILIAAGGLCYTFGSIFYVLKKIPFHHPIWHLFVLAGSACHFFGFLFYMAL